MALAWKAGWVHALTSSNLVSSAIAPEPHDFNGSGASFCLLGTLLGTPDRPLV